MDHALARQMIRQRAARRPLALKAFYLDLRRCGCRSGQLGLRLGFASIFFQIGELKLELFEDCAALGGLAVLLVAQLGDGELHLLARAFASASAARRAASAAISIAFSVAMSSGRESAVRGTPMRKAQLRLQRDTDVPHESIGRVVYPADCGRHVRCGARQSMPSSR